MAVAAADFAGNVTQRVACAVLVTVTSVVGMSSMTTLGVCQTMRRLIWTSVVAVVLGVEILSGLVRSCSVSVEGVSEWSWVHAQGGVCWEMHICGLLYFCS